MIQNITGNGLHAENGATVEATDCEFLSNGYTMDSGLGSACLIRDQSKLIGKRCVFENNFSHIDGGAIHGGLGCLLALDSCRFLNNGCNLWGGAIDVNSAKLQITNCEFYGNQGRKGGAAYLQTPDSTLFDHCIFTGNGASEGSVLYVSTGTSNPVTMLNCDFVRNIGTDAGAIRAESHLTLKHSIFYANTGAVVNFLDPAAQVEYCLFSGEDEFFTGTVPNGLGELNHQNHNGDMVDSYENLFADPVFADEPDGNLHLENDSPCIDAGDPTFPFDPDGTIADIGRYSFMQETAVAPQTLLPTVISVTAFPNPFNSSLELSVELPAAAEISLTIFDVTGREVEQLFSGTLATGEHRLMWNAAGVPTGVYFVAIESGGVFVTQKVLLLK
ncbi:MAG: T9SS type A sorting domain-containing protein [bacterium]|nr:T9SS type A sorting domain-containing protein [bacterium]